MKSISISLLERPRALDSASTTPSRRCDGVEQGVVSQMRAIELGVELLTLRQTL